jgi:lysozyme
MGGDTVINQASLNLIKEYEGFRAKAYQDSVGVWTVGFGTTAAAGVGIDPKPGMVITQAQAENYLAAAIEKFSAQIAPAITHPANPNEFGAMVSLAYNIGPGAFKRSSVLRRFNAGDKQGAAAAFKMWNKAGGKVLAGLTRRREAEAKLFLTPVGIGAVLPPRPAPAIPAPPIAAPSLWARFIAFIKGN